MALGKKRPFSFFGDFDDVFERIQEEMEENFKHVFEGFDEEKLEKLSNDPNARVYGFTLRVGPDGKPQVREFGNLRPVQEISGGGGQVSLKKGRGKQELADVREPLVDVIDHTDQATVIIELPGVNEKHLHTSVKNGVLTVKVNDPQRQFFKKLRLPKGVVESSLKSKLNNGILEVVFKKK